MGDCHCLGCPSTLLFLQSNGAGFLLLVFSFLTSFPQYWRPFPACRNCSFNFKTLFHTYKLFHFRKTCSASIRVSLWMVSLPQCFHCVCDIQSLRCNCTHPWVLWDKEHGFLSDIAVKLVLRILCGQRNITSTQIYIKPKKQGCKSSYINGEIFSLLKWIAKKSLLLMHQLDREKARLSSFCFSWLISQCVCSSTR